MSEQGRIDDFNYDADTIRIRVDHPDGTMTLVVMVGSMRLEPTVHLGIGRRTLAAVAESVRDFTVFRVPDSELARDTAAAAASAWLAENGPKRWRCQPGCLALLEPGERHRPGCERVGR